MKKYMRLLPLILCLIGDPANAADLMIENPQLYAELRDTTFTPLFQALRAGDVARIKNYISGDTIEQYRVLLEQNKEYGQFLRNYYAGASFELSQVTLVGNDYVANVLIYWPAGNTSVIKLQVHSMPLSTQGLSMQLLRQAGGGQARWTVGAPVARSGQKHKQ